eukprot:jgi/Mesvir1/17134/Mv07564-RA.1
MQPAGPLGRQVTILARRTVSSPWGFHILATSYGLYPSLVYTEGSDKSRGTTRFSFAVLEWFRSDQRAAKFHHSIPRFGKLRGASKAEREGCQYSCTGSACHRILVFNHVNAGVPVYAEDLCTSWDSCGGCIQADTPLHKASREGRLDIVRQLVASGASVNATDWYGSSPLHEASRNGRLDVVQQLIASGADMKAKDNDGWTPLHYTSRDGHLDVVRHLIASGADVNAKNNMGKIPLDLAEERKKTDVAQILRHAAAKPTEAQPRVQQPLAAATKLQAQQLTEPAKGKTADTSLHKASEEGRLDVVRQLLASRADIEAKDEDGDTPLHEASKNGHLDVVQHLIASGADVNAKSDYWWTPLHYASNRGHLDVVQHLIASGADVEAKERVPVLNMCPHAPTPVAREKAMGPDKKTGSGMWWRSWQQRRHSFLAGIIILICIAWPYKNLDNIT